MGLAVIVTSGHALAASTAASEGGQNSTDCAYVYGTSGSDTLLADEAAPCTVFVAGSGDDWVIGGPGDDIIFGGAGDDVLLGRDGNDVVWGGQGNDMAGGDAGDDELWGGSGDDRLWGGSGDDRLSGDGGIDQIKGEDGTDEVALLDGAPGDYADGGPGPDCVSLDVGDDRENFNFVMYEPLPLDGCFV